MRWPGWRNPLLLVALILSVASCSSSDDADEPAVPPATSDEVSGDSRMIGDAATDLTRDYPVADFPAAPPECDVWFSDWAVRFDELARAASLLDDSIISDAVASYGASARSEIADCLGGRSSDLESLQAEEARLIEATE